MCNKTGNPAYDGYGVINVSLWAHSKFRGLTIWGRLVFIYLIAGPETKPSGLFEVSEVSIQEEGGTPSTMTELERAGMIKYDKGLVWVKGMYENIKDGEVLLSALTQVRSLPASGMRQEFMLHNNIYEALPDQASGDVHEFRAAVANAMMVDVTLLDTDAIRAIDKLRALGYEVADVNKAFGLNDGLWYKHDWRGKNGQKPTIKNMILEPGIAAMLSETMVPKKHADKAEVVKHVRMALRASKTSAAREYLTKEHGDWLWNSLIKHKPWREWKRLEGDIKFQVYEALNES